MFLDPTRFEEGFSNGDEVAASENLRAYFEQHFHDSRDSGFRQHALLQHGRMHYQREEYAEARRVRILVCCARIQN
jgi:anaphase-promoting complex subunit 5